MHRITEPQTDDASIENQIQLKGKTAPRVTPADLEAEIASEHYFTAAHGVRAVLELEGVRPWLIGYDPAVPRGAEWNALDLLTICVLVLKNGFTVTGESACASPENFDADIGRRVARAKAIDKLWPLLGFRLRDKLASTPSGHIERMRLELEELDGRIARLEAFLKTETFAGLPIEEANRMRSQLHAMDIYHNVLSERYAAATPV
jgi:hypothetical protein